MTLLFTEALESRCLLSALKLDTSFGKGGSVVTHDSFVSRVNGEQIAVDTTGRILVAGIQDARET
jgi:hypothetical protein